MAAIHHPLWMTCLYWLAASTSLAYGAPMKIGVPVNPEPDFFSAEAYGRVHPEKCLLFKYNPNIRLATGMAMLMFPILFYAVYQCCCTGSHVSACCQRSESESDSNHSLVGSASNIPAV